MLHEVVLKNGKAIYVRKWVETNRLDSDDMQLLGDILEPIRFVIIFLNVFYNAIKSRGKIDRKLYGTANTAMEYHNGRVLALVENDTPTQVVLPELDTVGPLNFENQWNFPFSAHPKVDLETNELITFGYQLHQSPHFRYGVIDSEDKLINDVTFQFKNGAQMIHDFAVTKNHSIFMDLPATFKMWRPFFGIPALVFDKSSPAYLHVMPRLGNKEDIQTFKIKSCYGFHTANAWEENKSIHLYCCRYSDFDFREFGTQGFRGPTSYSKLYHYILNLKTSEVVEECIAPEIDCEFPTINLLYLGKKCRYVYAAGFLKNATHGIQPPLFDSAVKFDLQEKKIVASLVYGPNLFGGELVFIPKQSDYADSKKYGEDDGYLTTFVYNSKSKLSQMWIIDAKEFRTICKIDIKRRIPAGFHGKWISGKQIKNQSIVN